MKSLAYSLFKSRSGATDAESDAIQGNLEKKKCDSCAEHHRHTFSLPCRHSFCKDCIRGLFVTALNDKTYLPVKCCGQRVDQRLRREVLKLDECIKFETVLEEVDAPQMFCPRKDCSAFNNLDKVAMDPSGTFPCKKCAAPLCSRCRVCHPSMSCAQYHALPPQDRSTEDLEFFDLAQRARYARCSKCTRFVELMSGCSHVSCKCGASFDYVQQRFVGFQAQTGFWGLAPSAPAAAPAAASAYTREEVTPCSHTWNACNKVLDRPRLCHFCQKTKRCFQSVCTQCHLRICSLCKVKA